MSELEVAPTDIAVVGMACRFPGASSPKEFWELLRDGREARTELSDEALRAAGVPSAVIDNPNYVKAGMFLQGTELFDAGFFGFSPLDARIMDPQHRHFLECVWEALENAAYDPSRYDGAIGVFAGSGHNAYLPYNLLTNPELVAEVGFFLLRHTGNDKDFLATRASYCFDLKGPSVNVQTACSTSLVAIHSASSSLINGECDMALAGGVTIEMPAHQGYLFKDSEILSRDGHCRPFDASAGGTVFGSGVGVLVLKRLDDALADSDHIHAVLKSSAVNNDGAGKISYLAPSVDGQAAAVHEALAVGDIDPASVTYVECHGTGTPLGDPIEIAALSQAYGANSTKRQYCGIGSVKSNIGHLDTAAGVASVIKVILALQHRQLPATLHFRAPNEAIDFASSPFYVNAELRDWSGPLPLRAGVSSLGVGGTNAHVILQEAPSPIRSPINTAADRRHQLLLLSARSEQSLLRSRDRFARFFEDDAESIALADVAYTLAVGRCGFQRRGFAVVESHADASAALESNTRFSAAEAPDRAREVAFMFAGGGAQYPNMGRGLYAEEAVYRAAIDDCLQLLRAFVDFDLKPLLYPEPGRESEAASELERPSRTLPALFITQYAQAQLWRSWGVEPSAMIGHSMGENTAACLAGVFSLRDALGLVALRGRLFETVAAGSMLSVELSEVDVLPLLNSDLSLGAINAPQLTMVSGPKAALEKFEQMLIARDIGCRRIHIEVAAHSHMLDGILQPFRDYLRSIRLSAPTIPFVSNLSGDWTTSEQATDPEYWVKHLRHTVRFAEGVEKLLEADRYALLEVGPGRTLTSLTSAHGAKRPGQMIATSLPHPDENTPDLLHMLSALGQLWQAHVEIEWGNFYGGQKRLRVPLPTYAFDHARHWIEPGASVADHGRSDKLINWFYQPTWQRAAARPQVDLSGQRVFVLRGNNPQSDSIVRGLQSTNADVRIAKAGPRFSPQGELQFRPAQADDYVHLLEVLRQAQWQPSHVLNLLALDLKDDAPDLAQRALVFDSAIHFAQAAANEDWRPLRWLTLTRQSLQVGAESLAAPLAALALGPMRVLGREFPEWQCTLLDIDAAVPPSAVLSALTAAAAESVEVLRGNKRFVQRYRARTESELPARTSLREGGVYLITGGTGGLGLVAAAALAERQPKINLCLLARRPLPERQYWNDLIAGDAPEKPALQQLLAIEQAGTSVFLFAGDVADEAKLGQIAAQIQSDIGPLNGIVHTAGTIADALLLNKDFAEAESVLRPKVDGLLAIDRVFNLQSLDFVALYSSTSAFVGLPGQVDYAAANAFEDAFAHWLSERGVNAISINWPAWRSAGMAAAIANGQRYLPAGRPTAHPLLDRCIFENAESAIYATLFNPEQHWLLSEHRITAGPALIPGSGFIELARAAWAERQSPEQKAQQRTATVIREVVFELPFFVADRTHKALTIEVSGDRFVLTSDSFGDASVHARGIVESGAELNESIDVAAIRARCDGRTLTFDDADHHPFLAFGPRWRVLQTVYCGEREALIRLDMPAAFRSELDQLVLHPALLDMATAGAQAIVDGYNPHSDLYVPISYQRLHYNGRLPESGYSHVVLKPAASSEEIRFDVRVFDDTGAIALRVDGFTMRRIADINSFRKALPAAREEIDPALKRTLELGIENREGGAALLHILEHRLGPQTVVSPYPLDFLQQELLKPYQPEPVRVEITHDPDADADIADIENKLRDCLAIAQVVVRAFADAEDGRRLVAFFVPDIDHFTTQSELRRYARENLPQSLLPQQWVELDELPLAEDGAVDRSALLDPFAPQNTYVAPRTSVEKSLARIWQDALGVERVGLTENFFDLGGHSLLSTRVIVQIYKKFDVRLDQATMVLHTLEQIAREISEKIGGDKPDNNSIETATVTPSIETTTAVPTDKKKSVLQALFGGKK